MRTLRTCPHPGCTERFEVAHREERQTRAGQEREYVKHCRDEHGGDLWPGMMDDAEAAPRATL